MGSIRDVVDKALLTHKMGLTKIVKPIADRQKKLEEKVDHMSTQLNEVQTSMELLVSLS